MAVTSNGGAPYAPSTAILGFMDRHRNTGVPAPVTMQTLERLGISESLRPRTLQALRLLDFITEDGNLTEEFANLRRVPTSEYGASVAQLLRAAYADVFAIVEPSGATYDHVRDAFRGFTPPGQLDRMVALFLALLAHTGEWSDLPSPRGTASGNGGNAPRFTRVSAPSRKGASATPPPPPPARRKDEGGPYSQTVNLTGAAGTVTLSVDVNPIKLKGEAREFFFALVDMIDNYEQQAPGSA